MSWEKEALCSHKMNSWCCKICIAAGIDSCGHFRQLWFQWNMCWHQTQLKFQVTEYLDKRSFSQMNCSLVHCKSTVWACSTFPFLLVVSPIMTWDMLSSEMASDQSAVVWSCCRNVNPNKTNSVWDYNLKKWVSGAWLLYIVGCNPVLSLWACFLMVKTCSGTPSQKKAATSWRGCFQFIPQGTKTLQGSHWVCYVCDLKIVCWTSQTLD